MGRLQGRRSWPQLVAAPPSRAHGPRVGGRCFSLLVVAGLSLSLVACGGSALRAEHPAPPTTLDRPAPSPAPAGTGDTATTRAPRPAAASEPERHEPDPAGLDPARAEVLATHRTFWDAYVPPEHQVMTPRWGEVATVAEPDVVEYFRAQFERDVHQDGGLALHLDLTFRIVTVVVEAEHALVSGCVRHAIEARSTADDGVVAGEDEWLRYVMTLRGGAGSWRAHNVEVAEPCLG